jgi:hypothetical protein
MGARLVFVSIARYDSDLKHSTIVFIAMPTHRREMKSSNFGMG